MTAEEHALLNEASKKFDRKPSIRQWIMITSCFGSTLSLALIVAINILA